MRRDIGANGKKTMVCDMYLDLFKNLENVHFKMVGMGGKRKIFGFKVDMCDRFLNSGDFWWNVVYRRISKLGKMPSETCPVRAGQYYMKGVTIGNATRLFPTILPIFKMVITIDMYVTEKHRLIHTNKMTLIIRTVSKKNN